MFVLDPVQVRNKVFFFQEHNKDEEGNPVLIPCILVRTGYGWDCFDVDSLKTDAHGNKLVTMVSRKSQKEFYWYLKDVIYIQFHGAIPEGQVVRQLDLTKFSPHNFVLRKLTQGKPADTVATDEDTLLNPQKELATVEEPQMVP